MVEADPELVAVSNRQDRRIGGVHLRDERCRWNEGPEAITDHSAV
jgi:hypothetical protein